MADAGRVKHHIYNNIENPKNTLLFVGYAEPRSLAGRLKENNSEVKIFGENKKVLCNIEILDSYSAHGDYEEMLKYLSCQDGSLIEKVFLVHGSFESQQFFKERMKEKGFNNIYIPSRLEEHYL